MLIIKNTKIKGKGFVAINLLKFRHLFYNIKLNNDRQRNKNLRVIESNSGRIY